MIASSHFGKAVNLTISLNLQSNADVTGDSNTLSQLDDDDVEILDTIGMEESEEETLSGFDTEDIEET